MHTEAGHDDCSDDLKVERGASELLNDGQEEVFSHTAVERGLTRDPLAMDPETFKPDPHAAGSPAPVASGLVGDAANGPSEDAQLDNQLGRPAV